MQAVEEPDPERVFEEFDLPADGRLRDAEFVRRDREATQARDRFELDEGRHRRNEAPVSFGPCISRFHPELIRR
jgi:hypothetical protein